MVSIARFVEDARLIANDHDQPITVDWLPDGRTSLVVRALASGQGDAYVLGPRTRAKFKRASGFARTAMIRFKPGWSPALFGVPAHALTDQIVALDELWGARAITDDLVAARSVEAVLAHLSHAIATRAAPESSSARLARRAARIFETTETRVETVAQELGVTARHLRRTFLDSIGVGPKDFARGARLTRALRGAARTTDWSTIARDAGYYDQAHLIGDFRALLGLTPCAYLDHRAR